MSTPEVSRLIDKVPASIRHAVLDSGEFQLLTGDFVSAHVLAQASELVGRLRDAGGFEEELEELDSRPDYVAACADGGVQIVDDGGTFYVFNWKDLTTIELGDDGKGYIDFPRFAQDQGLDLAKWAWNTAEDMPVLLSDVNDDNAADVLVDSPVLTGLIKATRFVDASEVVDALVVIAQKSGKEELASALKDESKRKRLLEAYVVPNSVLCVDEFDSELDAARHACEAYDIEADYREVYEYWVVDDALAHALETRGEVVSRDFVGLTVWGRCTTGQSISMDGVISEIVRDWCGEEVDALVLKQFPNVGKHDENLIGVPLDMLKALEDDRVVRIDYTYKTLHGSERTEVVDLVLSGADETNGWRMESMRDGKKSSMNAGEPLPVAQIEANIKSYGEPCGPGFVSRGPSQEEIDHLVHGIARFHRMNASSEMHVVPEHLEERLAKLSPAYAAECAAENSLPSLG